MAAKIPGKQGACAGGLLGAAEPLRGAGAGQPGTARGSDPGARRCVEPGGAAAAGMARSRSTAQAGENVAFSTALFLSQVRLKMLCDTVIDSNLGINTSPQAPAQLIICIINTHIK